MVAVSTGHNELIYGSGRCSRALRRGGPIGGLALAVAMSVPSAALGKALASASIDIQSFVWYVDVDGDGAAGGPNDPDDRVLTARYNFPPGGSTDVVLSGGGLGSIAHDAALGGASGFAPVAERSITNSGGLTDMETGISCRGTGCSTSVVSPGFGAVTPPPTTQAATGYGEVEGYFAAVSGVPEGVSGGLRSDVSLINPGSTGDAGDPDNPFFPTGVWSHSSTVRATGNFATYYAVTFAAQALAYTEDPDATANAAASLTLTFDGTPWRILDISADQGDPDPNVEIPSTTLYSYDSVGVFDLVDAQSYTVEVLATTSASATTPPAEAPVPGAFWLVIAGGLPLAALRIDGLRARRIRRSGRRPEV